MSIPHKYNSPTNEIPRQLNFPLEYNSPQKNFPHEYNLKGQVKLLLIKINNQTEFSFLTVTATQIDCVNFVRISEHVQWNSLQVIINC